MSDLENKDLTENTNNEAPLAASQPSEEQADTPDTEQKEAEEKSVENNAPEQEKEQNTLTEEAIIEEHAKPSDEELEAEDTHEDEVSSDEEATDVEFSNEPAELPDYSSHSVDKLIEEAKKLLSEHPIQKLKNHFDEIRKQTLGQLNDERKAKLAEFLEQGGVEMDFEYIQPLREEFRNVYGVYRSKRKKHYADLEAQLHENLTIKNTLIDKLKELVTKDESIGSTFKEFNDVQQEWRQTGPVPRNESDDLWRNYHHHVDNFYEYIKINKELRDLDFKKNHEAKEALVGKAEELLEMESLREAFSRLQNLHKKWKFIGPVEREDREPLWERFQDATKKLHDKRETYFEEQRAKANVLIEDKKALVKEIADFPLNKIKNHKQWQTAIKGVEAIRQAFVKIGRLSHPENDSVWGDFREVLKTFNHEKNNFYKGQKQEFQDNLDKKNALLAKAEELKDSEEWADTTNVFKRIQADWKKIGHVPRSESDKIWKKFRGACNHFFERLSAKNSEQDAAFEGNLKQKQEILEQLKAFEVKGDQKETVKALKGYINQWKKVGKVPRGSMGIDQDFNKTLDDKFKAIDMDRKESQRIRFENRMETLTGADTDDSGLRRERSNLYQQKDEAEKELNQLENNMGFFSSSKSNNPLLKEAEKNIQRQRDFIAEIADKIKMLNIKIREVNKVVEEDKEADETQQEG